MFKKEKKKKKVSLIKRIKSIKILKEEETTYSFKEVLIVMLFSLFLGFFACFSFNLILNNGKDYRVLKKDLSKLVDTYSALTSNYYEDIDKETLVEDAIKGMMSSVGDIYTNYSDTDSTTSFKETVEGSYEGIGCSVGKNDKGQIIIVGIFDDSPAAKAGLQKNDIILEIDGKDYSKDKETTDMSKYIKENKNEIIKIKVKRGEEEKEIEVKRDKIEMPTVTSEIIEKDNQKVGYISISVFSSITTKQFEKELTKVNKEKISGLIIDVRSNGGGYLSVVNDIANKILPKDKVIYKLEKGKKITAKKDNTKECLTYPIAILVNGASASASEILAAAIKESYNGYVVGTKTYGKGTVQQTTTLPDGSMLKYTVQKWLTPNGNWLNEKGLEPTHEVEMSKKYYEDPTKENDNQLTTALELMTKK